MTPQEQAVLDAAKKLADIYGQMDDASALQPEEMELLTAVVALEPELPEVASAGHMLLRVVDLAAEGRANYGEERYAAIVGHPVPATDWRFELVGEYSQATLHRGATAEHVAAYLAHTGWVLAKARAQIGGE